MPKCSEHGFTFIEMGDGTAKSTNPGRKMSSNDLRYIAKCPLVDCQQGIQREDQLKGEFGLCETVYVDEEVNLTSTETKCVNS